MINLSNTEIYLDGLLKVTQKVLWVIWKWIFKVQKYLAASLQTQIHCFLWQSTTGGRITFNLCSRAPTSWLLLGLPKASMYLGTPTSACLFPILSAPKAE